MTPEEYWAQTRKKWEKHAISPYNPNEHCGFCRFAGARGCKVCPVVKVYGNTCSTVKSVKAYVDAFGRIRPDVEKLSDLAQAVVRELDDRKTELIEAMYDKRG